MRYADSGQRRRQAIDEGHVVEPGNRDDAGAGEAGIGDCFISAEGDQIVGGDDGGECGRAGDQRGRRPQPLIFRKRCGFGDQAVGFLEAFGLHDVDKAAAPRFPGRQGARPGDMGDAGVAERFEVTDGQRDAECVVADDGRHAIRIGGPIDQHQRQSVGDAFGDDGIVAPRGGEDQPIDLARPQGRYRLDFPRRDIVGIAEDGGVSIGAQPVFDAADNRRKQRIGDVGNQYADCSGAVGPETLRGLVRAVAQIGHSFRNLVDDLRRDPSSCRGVEDPRDG